MHSFQELALPARLSETLQQMNFDKPTPIQAQAIPHALEGRDVMGSAQTGTGKTGAFMIPVLAKLMEDPTAHALVMTPTRELATQVMDMTRKLMGQKSGIRTALLIGGEPMFKQFKQLDARARLIIGTPGRIDDHCRRNKTLLDQTNILVLDEADRMLDMGFSIQIDSILKYMPAEKQTLMFSATFAGKIASFAQQYLKNPVRVAVAAEKITADKIKHEVMNVKNGSAKFDALVGELNVRDGSVIVFVKTRRNADDLANRLSDLGDDNVRAEAIHGDLRQRNRDRTIKGFHMERFRVLVATDVASRGLDIPHVAHVINYDLPQNPEDYVHRIGRTARAGAEGNAVCFLTPADGRSWATIARLVFPGQSIARHPDEAQDQGGNHKKGRSRSGARGGNRDFSRKKEGFRPANDKGPSRDEDRPSFGKPAFKKSGSSAAKPRQNDGERPSYGKPSFRKEGNAPVRAGNRDNDRFRSESERPERSEDRPKKVFKKDDFKPRSAGSEDRPKKNFKKDDFKPRSANGEERPAKSFKSNKPLKGPQTKRSQSFKAGAPKAGGAPKGQKPRFKKAS